MQMRQTLSNSNTSLVRVGVVMRIARAFRSHRAALPLTNILSAGSETDFGATLGALGNSGCNGFPGNAAMTMSVHDWAD
jgi:hypothetical protein